MINYCKFFVMTIVLASSLSPVRGKGDAAIPAEDFAIVFPRIAAAFNDNVKRLDVQDTALAARSLAKQMVADYGDSAIAYLKAHLDDCPPLAVAYLDLQVPGEPAAEALAPMKARAMLLLISYCSDETRLAEANLMAKQLLQHQGGNLPFATICGDKQTAPIILQAGGLSDGSVAAEYQEAADHIRSRVALKPEDQKQRAHEELVIWQSLADEPKVVRLESGMAILAQRLDTRQEHISWDYLHSMLLDNSSEKIWLASYIITKQMERDAIPTLQAMVHDSNLVRVKAAQFALTKLLASPDTAPASQPQK